MCSTLKHNVCMGRNYDYEQSYDEEVIIIPQGFKSFDNKYGFVGIGSGLFQDYPMMYDGINSEGLCISGLAFTGNAVYHDYKDNKVNVAPYEIIPYVLSNFKSVNEFQDFVNDNGGLNITNKTFKNIDNAELHWFICDKEKSIVVESTIDGVNTYDNFHEVLTNNPPFSSMVSDIEHNLEYVGTNVNVSQKDTYYSRGMETEYLDGSYTSMGRFERLAYLKKQLESSNRDVSDKYGLVSVNDTFHLLASVEQIYGATPVNDMYEYTIYSVVYNMIEKSIYVRHYNNFHFIPLVMNPTFEGEEIKRYSIQC